MVHICYQCICIAYNLPNLCLRKCGPYMLSMHYIAHNLIDLCLAGTISRNRHNICSKQIMLSMTSLEVFLMIHFKLVLLFHHFQRSLNAKDHLKWAKFIMLDGWAGQHVNIRFVNPKSDFLVYVQQNNPRLFAKTQADMKMIYSLFSLSDIWKRLA